SKRLEQLDGIPGRIVNQDLLPTIARDDLAAEVMTRRLQSGHLIFEIRDLKLNAVPATRGGTLAIRHGLAGTPTAARLIEQQVQLAAAQAGESGRGMHVHSEVECPCIELDRRVDVVDDVPNADCHFDSSSLGYTTKRTR